MTVDANITEDWNSATGSLDYNTGAGNEDWNVNGYWEAATAVIADAPSSGLLGRVYASAAAAVVADAPISAGAERLKPLAAAVVGDLPVDAATLDRMKEVATARIADAPVSCVGTRINGIATAITPEAHVIAGIFEDIKEMGASVVADAPVTPGAARIKPLSGSVVGDAPTTGAVNNILHLHAHGYGRAIIRDASVEIIHLDTTTQEQILALAALVDPHQQASAVAGGGTPQIWLQDQFFTTRTDLAAQGNQILDFTEKASSGDTGAHVLYEVAIPANNLTQEGYILVASIAGKSVTGSGGDKTVDVKFGGTIVGTLVVSAGEDWFLTSRIYILASNEQLTLSIAQTSAGASAMKKVTTAVDMTGATTLQVTAQSADGLTGDVVMQKFELDLLTRGDAILQVA